jgi:uncharacterized protein YkwD
MNANLRARALVWLLAASLAGWGCKPKPPEIPAKTPGAASGEDSPQKGRSREPAVIFYEDQAGSEAPSGLPKEMFQSVSAYYAEMKAGKPRFDARLSAAALVYAKEVPIGGTLPRKYLDHYLAMQGIVEPYPRMISLVFGKGAEREFIEKFDESLPRLVANAQDADLRVGISIVEREGEKMQAIMLLLPGRLSVSEVPREAKPKDALRLTGGLAGAYKNPRLVITGPDGTPFTLRGEENAARFSYELEFKDGKGRYEVEVLADGSTGPEVCGLFSVYAGVEPPELPPAPKRMEDVKVSAEEAERTILTLVNQARTRAGLAPLEPLDSARKVARLYSEEMRETGKVGHISPRSGKPEDRLKKGGVKSSLVLENVARSVSPEDAHDGLMESPGHRANVLNPKVTHVGIGVAVQSEEGSPTVYYVTQNFVKQGGDDPKKLQKELPQVLNGVRSKLGHDPLEEDPKLTELAKRYAAQYETGSLSKDNTVKRLFEELAKDFSAAYAQAAPLVTVLPYLEPLGKAKGFEEPQFTNYGAAVLVAGKGSPHGEGSLVVVVLIASKRTAATP